MGFSYDAGRVSLDLLATLSNRREERLVDPGALDEWLIGGGLLDAPASATDEDLARVRVLRMALFAVIDAELRGECPRTADLEAINVAAAVPAQASRLVLGVAGLRAERGRPSVVEILGDVARDAIDLLTGPQRGLLRECAAPDCSGIYVDASRGRNRRWCSAARCGNRTRVARHRARHAADSPQR